MSSRQALRNRVLDHARWRLSKINTFARTEGFLDLHLEPERALYLSSWPRSGSTWVSEMIARTPGTRFVFEPSLLNTSWTPGEPRVRTIGAHGVGDDLGASGHLLERALSGRLRSLWSDRITTSRWPERRIVKDVNTIEAMPAIAATFPSTPTVLLVRHPLATCHSIVELSQVELGWSVNGVVADRDPDGPPADPQWRGSALVAEVAEWVRQHSLAMTHEAMSSAHVMLYEDVVSDPSGELERLAAYLSGFHASWSRWVPDPSGAGVASTTSFRRAEASKATWVDSWSDSYDQSYIDEALQLVERSSIAGLYGSSPLPIVPGADALAAVRGDKSA